MSRPGPGYAAGVPWEWPVGAACSFVLALVTTPAGVSGAVLLLPIQLSVLHVPSPAVTPTNLLFNVARSVELTRLEAPDVRDIAALRPRQFPGRGDLGRAA